MAAVSTHHKYRRNGAAFTLDHVPQPAIRCLAPKTGPPAPQEWQATRGTTPTPITRIVTWGVVNPSVAPSFVRAAGPYPKNTITPLSDASLAWSAGNTGSGASERTVSAQSAD